MTKPHSEFGNTKRPNDILADYRNLRLRLDDRIGTHSARCHMWRGHERCMLHRLAREVERLRDELESATRHMELAEAAWLRETMGSDPTPSKHTTPMQGSEQEERTCPQPR